MKCDKCLKDFPENLIHESHDVPCYLFYDLPNRKARKHLADKEGRHYLCQGCHLQYEKNLSRVLKAIAKRFSKRWFEDGL